ncbi:TIR domain-containing protein [Streptomyces poonensis]|uniref:TIR domain-containing protein n=1 Tax=Streptomyces poonensis TaxID=68255 RepID=A0A918UEJ0_9ACTN|nr:TIR domain-containing protein [Streptomyces poonensis]GGY97676.1 hypothetical protein GCM10010365_15200 [Streptomyces poonensis]
MVAKRAFLPQVSKKSTGVDSYRAFISYSHAADNKLAPRLQRGLHQLAKPWYRAPSFRVFRDETSLTATPAMWSSIERALSASEFFILLASPDSARSKWVDREVAWWLAHRSPQQILIGLTNGELTWDDRTGDFVQDPAAPTLPKRLQGVFTEEPRVIRLSWARTENHVSLRNGRFRDAVAEFAAPLHGRSKEDLVGEDLRQQRRMTWWRNAAIGSLTILALVASVSSVQFFAQRNTAREQRDLAVSRQLAAESTRIVDTQPENAILVGLESLNAAGKEHRNPPTGLVTGLARLQHASERYSIAHTLSVSYSSDGRKLALGEESGTIRLTDPRTPDRSDQTLRGHTSGIRNMAFSKDGRLLASTGDNSVRLWSVATGRPYGAAIKLSEPGNGVAFSPDGKLVASGGVDKAIRLWDVATGKPRGKPLQGHTDAVTDVAFSPDGRLLGSAGADETVRLWDVTTGKPRGKPLQGHTDDVQDVEFTPDRKILASASMDKTVRLWDVTTGKPRGKALQSHVNTVNALAISPDGKTLASAGGDMVHLWDTDTGRPQGLPLVGHTDNIWSLAFRPDGKQIATVSGDKALRLWETAVTPSISQALTGHTGEVFDAEFSRDGKRLATASGDGTVRLWDPLTRRPLGKPLHGHTGWVIGVAFSPDGSLVASAGEDRTVRLWNVATGRPHGKPLIGHMNWTTRVDFSPDGRLLASASNDKIVRLWDVATGRPFGSPLRHDRGVLGVAFSPDGKTLASADNTVRLWDVASGRQIREPLNSNAQSVNSVAFSPDSKMIASADNTVRLWDVASGRQIREPLEGHTGTVADVTFSPDGKLLASSGIDGTARMWEVPSGQPVGPPLTGHETTTSQVEGYAGAVNQVVFSPNGKQLATAGDDTTVRLWNPEFSGWADYGCEIVNRNLSRAEWRHLAEGLPYHRTCPEAGR